MDDCYDLLANSLERKIEDTFDIENARECIVLYIFGRTIWRSHRQSGGSFDTYRYLCPVGLVPRHKRKGISRWHEYEGKGMGVTVFPGSFSTELVTELDTDYVIFGNQLLIELFELGHDMDFGSD